MLKVFNFFAKFQKRTGINLPNRPVIMYNCKVVGVLLLGELGDDARTDGLTDKDHSYIPCNRSIPSR